ncbi:hypothetical protein HR12_07100, partial [Microbacterium sp. SUBG005]
MGAVLAYFLQMVAFIVLRRKFPNAVRPYKSPWGLFGAYSAAIIAAVVFFGLLLNPAYLLAIVAIIVVYAVIFIAFAVYGRHRLVLSPEEEYALSGWPARRPAEGGLRRDGGRGLRRPALLSEDDGGADAVASAPPSRPRREHPVFGAHSVSGAKLTPRTKNPAPNGCRDLAPRRRAVPPRRDAGA